MLVAVLTGGMFFLIQDFLIETRGFSCAYKCDMSPNPASFGSHCHEDYEMIFILDGRGRYVVEGREYTMNPGMLIILKPGEFHYAEILGTHPYERYVVHFERPLLSELCLQYLDYICDPSSNVSNCYDPDVVPGRVRVIFDGFRYGSMMNDLTKRTYCSMLIFEILIFIADKAVYNRYAVANLFGERRRIAPYGHNAVLLVIVCNGGGVGILCGNHGIFFSNHTVPHRTPADKIRISRTVAAFGGKRNL